MIESSNAHHPNLLGALREAELSVTAHWCEDNAAECRAKALALLRAHICHWTFKATYMLVPNLLTSTVARASREFQAGMLMMDRDAAVWPSCVYLLENAESMTCSLFGSIRGILFYHNHLIKAC